MSKDIISIQVEDREGVTHELDAPTDMAMNLMEVLKSYELPVEGVCGGMALCASCHCYVVSDHDINTRNDDEQAMLDDTDDVKENSRLACQIRITEAIDQLKIQLAPVSVTDDVSDW